MNGDRDIPFMVSSTFWCFAFSRHYLRDHRLLIGGVTLIEKWKTTDCRREAAEALSGHLFNWRQNAATFRGVFPARGRL